MEWVVKYTTYTMSDTQIPYSVPFLPNYYFSQKKFRYIEPGNHTFHGSERNHWLYVIGLLSQLFCAVLKLKKLLSNLSVLFTNSYLESKYILGSL